jgi:hypothetical protein
VPNTTGDIIDSVTGGLNVITADITLQRSKMQPLVQSAINAVAL